MRKIFLYVLLVAVAVSAYSCVAKKKVTTLDDDKHEYMQKTYEGLKDSVSEAQITILNDTIKVLFPENLLFKTASSEILEDTYPLMQRFANALNTYNKTSILINGYTDNTGTADVNEKISLQRADNSKNVLLQYAVTNSRLFTNGFGPRYPLGDNTTEEGRAKNRRVEFIVLYTVK